MLRTRRWWMLAMLIGSGIGFCGCAPTQGTSSTSGASGPTRTLYDRVTPSLVVVQYVFENELGKNPLTGAGIVVSEDGLVAASLDLFPSQFPDAQMHDFKIVIPHPGGEPEELKATFEGRDDRTGLAFLKAAEPRKDKQPWVPVKFEDVSASIGDDVTSVGLLPKMESYRTYYMESTVAATLRGQVPQVLCGGGLTAAMSPVFNAGGKAIGIVSVEQPQALLLDRPDAWASVQVFTPKEFTPASDFLISFTDPPSAGHPLALPWLGVPGMTGLSKDLSDAYGLDDQPAIQVGDVIEDTPASKAGLLQGDIIVKVNGKPLERGDESSDDPLIFARKMLRHKPGDKVILSVLRDRGKPLTDITITLGERPAQANTAARFWADDMGFGVRDLVLYDLYPRKLPRDQKGVVVTLMRKSSAAENAGLHQEDLITQLNGKPVADEKEFASDFQAFRKDKPHESVVLVVLREGQENTVRIEPPQ